MISVTHNMAYLFNLMSFQISNKIYTIMQYFMQMIKLKRNRYGKNI